MISHNIGQFFALQYFKLFNRYKYKSRIVSIFEHISSASHVCVCLPCNEKDFNESLISIEQFRQIFPKAHITLLNCTDQSISKQKFHAFRLLTYDRQKLTFLGLPSKEIRHDIATSKFDVVIDLSLSFSFVNTALSWLSNAGLRICFNDPKRDNLYNFVVRLVPETKWDKSYQQLLQYLGAKKSSVNE
ncbi:MAG: glycosyltransferase family 9 protein [Calditrichaeota bacterium]|nr:glycosyltransferase family 9 protein [Calditrichota bacterium]